MSPDERGPQPTATTKPRRAPLRVLRALVSQPSPVTISTLAGVVGGHPNGVRLHLDQLEADGYVEVCPTPVGTRGRPAKVYRATVLGRQVAGQRPGAADFAALVAAFADEVAGRPDAAAFARRLGLAWGRRLRDASDTRADLVSVLAAQGYTPEPDGDRIRLLTCPFVDIARVHPEVLCSLHQGLVEGLAERPATIVPFAEPDACVVEYDPHPRSVP